MMPQVLCVGPIGKTRGRGRSSPRWRSVRGSRCSTCTRRPSASSSSRSVSNGGRVRREAIVRCYGSPGPNHPHVVRYRVPGGHCRAPHVADLWSVLVAAGELDVVGAPELRQHVIQVVRDGHHRLVLDLTGAGLSTRSASACSSAHQRVRLLDGDLRLVIGEPRVRRVLEVRSRSGVRDPYRSRFGGRCGVSMDTSRIRRSCGPGSIAIEIRLDLDFVSFVRVVVAAAAELRPDIAIERIEDLKLAVSEAVTNSINAQDRVGTIDRIRIECEVTDDEIVFIHDRGQGRSKRCSRTSRA